VLPHSSLEPIDIYEIWHLSLVNLRSFVMSVCTHAQFDNLWVGFHKILYWRVLRGIVELFEFTLESGGRDVAETVSRRPPTAEARVRFRVCPCRICGGQSGTRTGFPPVLRFSPVNFIPPVLHCLEKLKIYSYSSQGCTISLKPVVRP
jgi:hypothetical protein